MFKLTAIQVLQKHFRGGGSDAVFVLVLLIQWGVGNWENWHKQTNTQTHVQSHVAYKEIVLSWFQGIDFHLHSLFLFCQHCAACDSCTLCGNELHEC